MKKPLIFLSILWLSAVVAGTSYLVVYKNTPGSVAAEPNTEVSE